MGSWLKPAGLALAMVLSPFAAPGQEIIKSHGISSFGDLKYPADFPHFDYVNPDAPQGGTMSFRPFLASTTFDSLNYYILKGEAAQGLERLYDQLMVRAYDEPDAVYGQIAESAEWPEDRSWVIFNLRPEARFSDGHPITAEDIAFTIEAVRDRSSPRFSLLVSDVTGTEILGDHRIKVTFKEEANTRDLAATVGELYVLPKHYYDTVDYEESTLAPPVGSGEYLVSKVDPGRSITYCKNPDYWGRDLPVNVGMDNFDCVAYEYFTDNTAAFEAFKSGTYLFHEEFFSALWATNYDFPALNNGYIIQDTLEDGRPSGTQGYWINMRREKFQDVRVRNAIALLFNFEWSNQTLFYGLYGRTDSFWEGSTMEASGDITPEEATILEPYRHQIPPEVFTEPAWVPPVNTTQLADRRAIRAAGALLDEAGWISGDDGIRRNAAGEALSITFIEDNPGFERITLPFIENLERVGIEATFELIDPAQMQQRQEDFDFDMIAGRFVMLLSPSTELRSIFGSAAADAPGSFNFSGLEDPVVDDLIDRIIGAQDRETMETHVRALDRVLRAKHIWVSNWTKGEHWVAYWDVFGRPDIKPPYVRGEDYWWFDQAKFDALVAAGALRR